MERSAKIFENAAATATLVEAGIALMRQNLRRRHPEADEIRIDDLLKTWLYRTDDPIQGDVAGSVRIRR
jgi:hypothetical protein